MQSTVETIDIVGSIEGKDLGRIEEVLKKVITAQTAVSVCDISVHLHILRDLRTLAIGKVTIEGRDLESQYRKWKGNFEVKGYRSNNTPLGLDKLSVIIYAKEVPKREVQ